MKRLVVAIAILLALAMSVPAQQSSTGTLGGTVTDSSGQVVPGASIKLTNEVNAEERTATTNESGDFLFAALVPAPYTVRIEAKGFRPYEQKGNIVVASGRLSLGNLQLQVGSLTESIVVTAQAPRCKPLRPITPLSSTTSRCR